MIKFEEVCLHSKTWYDYKYIKVAHKLEWQQEIFRVSSESKWCRWIFAGSGLKVKKYLQLWFLKTNKTEKPMHPGDSQQQPAVPESVLLEKDTDGSASPLAVIFLEMFRKPLSRRASGDICNQQYSSYLFLLQKELFHLSYFIYFNCFIYFK